ncbi:MAG: hypothetical protein H6855_02875 [Rhodospirillales bacterium]|nr:hypothetical protein [Rhodospirillales bacterium]MCB9965010.1 hypothetical protein [Rhodospirillales bacterium]MCB9973399.1 hypothetical protein [Rhodospirillales bacterium]MCB9980401.1 hypothetical protein [Rhodospirillales bacterium]
MKPIINKDIKELILTLNKHNTEYLIIGGFAYGMHVEMRATKDFDVWISTSEENAKKVFQALAEFGAPVSGLSEKDFQDEETLFMFGIPPNRIDIIPKIDGLTFEEAWKNRISQKAGDLEINLISLDDLIKNKQASGRDQDLVDVKALKRVKKLLEEHRDQSN